MLRFSLKYGKNLEAILNAAQEEGDDIPEPIKNAPVLNPDYGFYWRCFLDLSTDRPQSISGIGPIPWSSIYRYCEAYNVKEQISTISEIIKKVDNFYCEKINSDLDKKVKSSNVKI